MRSSVSPDSRRRSEWPRITHVARPASIGARHLAGVRAGQLVVDVLGADADVLAGERVADGGEAHERRADDPGDAGGSRVRAAIVRGQLAGIGRGGVHLPVGGDRRPGAWPDHARGDPAVRAAPGGRSPPPRAGPSRGPRPRRRGGPAARAGRAPAAPPIGGGRGASASSRERRLGRLAPGRGDGSDASGLLAQPAVGLERVDRRELAARRGDRPLQVRRLGVEHPVELAAQAPRDLARLELEQRRAGPDPAEERGDRLGALPGDDAVARGGRATTPAARPRPAARASSARLARRRRRTRGARGRRRGSASRGRGTGRAATPIRQCSAEPVHSNGSSGRTNTRRARPPTWAPGGRGRSRSEASTVHRAPPSRTTSRASAGSRVWTRDPRPAISARRSHGRAGSTAASSARSAATRSRSVPDIRLRSTPRSGRPVRAGLARSPAVAALALPRADDGGGEAGRIVVVGVLGVHERRRGRARRRGSPVGGQRSRTGSPQPAASARARRTGCWRARCRQVGRAVASERVDVVREVEAARLARLRRHVAHEHDQGAATPRSPRGSRAPPGRAGGS